MAEMLERGLFGERALRPQIGHGHAALQAAAGRHDLGPDGGHGGLGKRPRVAVLQAADHFGFALGAQHRAIRVRGVLDRAHFLRGARALRQQVEDLGVDGVDAVAQRPQLVLQGIIHGGARTP
ncbi:Uncharacterised protein [Bordetella pertussis]|nr:Uncharacterised protein [Bordetella pertussis]